MSPRTPEDNQRIREERRELILKAAASVFAAKGLAPAKIEDIAKAAGVSYGLVYHYVGTKEAVFGALVEQGARASKGLAAHLQQHPGALWDRLRWLTAVMTQGLREQPELFLISLEALTKAAVPPEIREAAISGHTELRSAVTGLIAQGQAEGQIVEGEPEHLANLYLSTLNVMATTIMTLRPERRSHGHSSGRCHYLRDPKRVLLSRADDPA